MNDYEKEGFYCSDGDCSNCGRGEECEEINNKKE
jgi:hypothetical protein